MQKTLASISSLLISVAILLLGSGLLGTLLSLRASLEGYTETAIGLIASMYFLGFIVGTFVCPKLIQRSGHIRSFSAVAAVASCTILIYGLWVDPLVWMVNRFVTGICLVSIYMIIESWLNAQARNEIRGRVFAAYMMINLLFLALGQFLILAGEIRTLELFAVAAILFSLGLVPLAMTRLPEPAPVHEIRPDIRELLRQVPSGFMGSLVSGVIGSAFWGLGPLYALQAGLSEEGIALFMSATIIGGALLQWPLGLYSDRRERRRVLMDISLLGAAIAVIILLLPADTSLWLTLAMFFYGGMMFSIYPISAALTNDYTDPARHVETSGNLLMVYGLGATAGPLLGGLAMQWFGPGSLFWLFVASGLFLAGWVNYQRISTADVPEEEKVHFTPLTRTSQVAAESIAESLTEPAAAESEETAA
jgi:MFS family permease